MEENEIRKCSWCGCFVEISEERIVRSKWGNVLLHDEKGRLHSVWRKEKEEDSEQETEQTTTERGQEGREATARDSEQAEDFDRFCGDIFGDHSGDGDSTNTEGE